MTVFRRSTRVATAAVIALVCLPRPVQAQGEPHRSTLPGASVHIGSLRVPASVFTPDRLATAVASIRLTPLRLSPQATRSQGGWASRHPSGVGALIGLAAGVVLGAIVSKDQCFFHSEDTCRGFSAVVFGGIGAGSGALAGLAF